MNDQNLVLYHNILALLILLRFTGEDELDEERDLIIQAIEKL
jgi:hypothetical protein